MTRKTSNEYLTDYVDELAEKYRSIEKKDVPKSEVSGTVWLAIARYTDIVLKRPKFKNQFKYAHKVLCDLNKHMYSGYYNKPIK
jgi:hypothetical protein